MSPAPRQDGDWGSRSVFQVADSSGVPWAMKVITQMNDKSDWEWNEVLVMSMGLPFNHFLHEAPTRGQSCSPAAQVDCACQAESCVRQYPGPQGSPKRHTACDALISACARAHMTFSSMALHGGCPPQLLGCLVCPFLLLSLGQLSARVRLGRQNARRACAPLDRPLEVCLDEFPQQTATSQFHGEARIVLTGRCG